MNRILLILAALLLFSGTATAQTARRLGSGATLPESCNPGPPVTDVYYDTDDDILYTCTALDTWAPVGSEGSVSSVALTVPAIMSVSGSPITTSGTLGITLNTQSANAIFGGPTSGSAATPTFRALVSDDIPSLAASKITSGTFTVPFGGTGASSRPLASPLSSPDRHPPT